MRRGNGDRDGRRTIRILGIPTELERRDTPAAGSGAIQNLFAVPPSAGHAPAVALREYRPLAIDPAAVARELAGVPTEAAYRGGAAPVAFTLPAPDGANQRFAVVDAPVMEPGLAARFPDIRTYQGRGIDDPTATVRMDVGPLGFHAMVISAAGTWMIDPYYHLRTDVYASYYRDDAVRPAENHGAGCGCALCAVAGRGGDTAGGEAGGGAVAARSGAELRTYRLAVAATGEYTAVFGGTVDNGQAAIVTAVNRVSGIYESELSIRLVLVANNSSLVFTNAFSDPYTNSDPFALLAQNQATIDSIIGPANYDIGHVFSTAGGGLAGLGVVGIDGVKALGETGLPNPVGDPFYVDYVAHEIGHQFGANHSFNTASDPNRNGPTAYEPGSGSTIMAYAGITGPDSDLQPNSDPFFNTGSFDEIIAFVDGAIPNVGTRTPTENNVPTVDAGPTTFVIPAGTPFVLTAVGFDADAGDTLTYSWEGRDLGPATFLSTPDNGSSPLFRVYNPTTNPSRTFPRLTDLISNTNTVPLGERLPAVDRTMQFRVTVRDNRIGGGGVNTADTQVRVVNTGSAFTVTSHNTNVTWIGGTAETITWNVAGTTGNGINAQFVTITLSTDGGLTYPITLAAAVPNDGSETITVPAVLTNAARIRIQPTDNIFFDISDVDFTVFAMAIISDGGGDTATVSAFENQTAVTTVAAAGGSPTTPIAYSIVGGADEALFAIDPTTGVLTFLAPPNFEVPADANGDNRYLVTVQASDGTNTDTQEITVVVADVNEIPSFVGGPDQVVLEDAGPQTAAGFATGIQTGPDPEAGQTVSFTVTADNPALFSVQPAIAPDGKLTYTTAPNANGTATITVVMTDSGGTANGGVDSTAPQTFAITVTPVNDAPTFAVGPNQSTAVGSAGQTVPGFASGIAAGPPDEAGQTVSFTVTADNPALFAVQPAIAPDGTLTYTPAPGAVGKTTIAVVLTDSGGTADGGVDTSAPQTFAITITPINTPPVFAVGPNQTVLEDAGPQSVPGFAAGISAGGPGQEEQTVSFTVTADNPALFAVQPAISADGKLTYTLAPDANGSATVTVVAQDTGGTANGGVDTSAPQTFTITVTPVNDAPSFAVGSNQTVLEDAGPQTVPGFAAGISAGPADEAGQALSFTVTVDNPALFAVLPTITPDGKLTYTAAPNASGVATITVVLTDSGGTANGGSDTSAAQTFTITVVPVNDAPNFAVGPNQTVIEDAGPQSVPGFASGISAGPPNEAGQAVSFTVTADNPALFAVQPAISADGKLTYTPAANANGSATITAFIRDNGGTDVGGVDASASQTFTITVTPVNDAPSFAVGPNQAVRGDAGPQSISGFLTGISAGPADEAGQTVSFTVTVNDPTLFAVLPSITADGKLTYTPSPTANGTAAVAVVATDTGGTANGGANASAPQTFTVSVTSFADPVATPAATAEDTLSAAGLVLGTGLAGSPVAFFHITAIRGGRLFLADGATPVADGEFIPVAAGRAGLRFLPDADANDKSAPGGFGFRVQNSTSASAAGLEGKSVAAAVSVAPVNDLPEFSVAVSPTAAEDAGPQTVAGFATGIAAGPPTATDEAGQRLAFTVAVIGTTDGLTFTRPPTVDPATGALAYETAPDSFGTARLEITLDDGNGGRVSRFADLTVTPVNDLPVAAVLQPAVAVNRAGPRTIPAAFAFSPGAANEADPLTAAVEVVETTGRLRFAVPPAVAPDGTLTFDAAPGSSGTATLAVTLSDGSGFAPVQFITVDVGGRVGLIGVPEFAVGADAGRSDVTLFDANRTAQFTLITEAPGVDSGVRTAVADFNGDGIADLVVASGPGGIGVVSVYDGSNRRLLFSTRPYELDFAGGLFVAAGDVDGDRIPDLVVSPDRSGGPRVDVYSGKGFIRIASFFGIDDPNFRGGVRIALGDLNGDGAADLVVAAGVGGGPRVAVFDGRSLTGTPRRLVADFFAFEESLRNGVYVAVGDTDGDGLAEIIAGGGPGGGPRVVAFSGGDLLASNGATLTPVLNFFAGDPAGREGVRVAVKDFDDDERADLLTGPGTDSGTTVRGYLGRSEAAGVLAPAFEFEAFADFAGGVFVG